MFGLISKGALPEPATADWILDVYAWLLGHTGGIEVLAERSLVLPTDEFFPLAARLEGHDLAAALFERTRTLAGMDGWPCRLVAQADGPSARDLLGHAPHAGEDRRTAAGTFSVTGVREIEISYSPATLRDPMCFVATMAHELSHYLMATIPVAPPGGPEAEEPATDVCSAFLGFGVFTAEAAFSFRQYQDGNLIGWESSRHGYLDERELAYALGVFLALRGLPAAPARRHLKTNPRSYLKHAVRELRRRRKERLAGLRTLHAWPPTAGYSPS